MLAVHKAAASPADPLDKVLTGLFVKFELGKITFAATDGTILIEEVAISEAHDDPSWSMILQAAAIKTLTVQLKVFEPHSPIVFGPSTGDFVTFVCGGYQGTLAAIPGESFPNIAPAWVRNPIPAIPNPAYVTQSADVATTVDSMIVPPCGVDLKFLAVLSTCWAIPRKTTSVHVQSVSSGWILSPLVRHPGMASQRALIMHVTLPT